VTDAADLWRLTRAVARQVVMADVWPALHDEALRASGAAASVLLRLEPRSKAMLPSSAVGLDHLGHEPWITTDAAKAAAERVWTEGAPQVFASLPELATRLGTPAAMLVPISAREGRLGLLILGVHDIERATAAVAEVAIVGELIALTLDRARLQREADLQRDLRELATDFSRAVSSSLNLAASLEIFCDRGRRLFSTDRVSVWLFSRRAGVIELVASSDVAAVAGGQSIAANDAQSDIATAMRAERGSITPPVAPGAGSTVLIPLRGRRRALGTLSIEGVRLLETGDEFDLLDRLEEVGRQLASAIENLWLLEDVLRSRRELESTVNSLADLVVVSDSHSRITHSNAAFARRLGKRLEQIVSRPLGDFFGPEFVRWLSTLGDAPGGDKQFHTQELRDSLLAGTFLFTVSPLVGRDEDQIGMVIVARDISDESRHEAERTELRNRLTQSEKLAALGQFVAGIAHELNNPLQGVLGHVELMLHSSAQLSARVKRDLKLVFREADRAAKIVHNLLVFAGSRRIARRRLNVSLVVGRALSLRATACAAAGIDVVKDLAPKLPRIAGDSLLLQQALLNIIVNAEQALTAVSGARRIDVRTMRQGKTVLVRVSDNGPGIAADVLPRLFEPFFTTKEVGKGTGLGLAIAYGIVQEHGGQLHASNRAEGGAMFTVELPAGSDGVE
jgi:signal transduction histidine kinase